MVQQIVQDINNNYNVDHRSIKRKSNMMILTMKFELQRDIFKIVLVGLVKLVNFSFLLLYVGTNH